MCIILDANCQSDFLNHHGDMEPLHKWINKNGKIAYSTTDQFAQEMTQKFREKLKTLRQSGKAKHIAPKEVQAKQKTLTYLVSNDGHIIALALVANVKVLVSKDQNLHEDFKRHVNGSIYQKASHKRLLEEDLCP